MSDIYLDRDNVERRMNDLIGRTDEVESVLGSMPPAPDGGSFSEMLAFIVGVGAQAAGLAADTHRALAAISIDVMNDMSLTEAEAGEEFEKLDDRLEEL